MGNGYTNEFIAMPCDQFIPPYYNEKAYPKAEKQRALVTDNNDSLGLGRVRVRFDWMKPEQQSPWLRIVFPYAGAGKGHYFLPEIEEEVMIDFENDNMEKPFVIGTLYNGNQKSNYYNSKNQLKALHTKHGHVLEFDEREESIGITIKDKNNNYIHLNTKENNLEMEALETIRMKAKNMEIDIQESINTKAGKDIKTTAGEEIYQHSGKKTLLHSSQNMEVEAMNHLDLYGKQKLITYTQGNAEMGALGQMHVHGTSALYSAKITLDYKAPNMGRISEEGDFLYSKEGEIIMVKWVNKKGDKIITDLSENKRASIWIQTRNIKEGETITINVEEKDIQGNINNIEYSGIINSNGEALLSSIFSFKKDL
ncbi:hypothetical protein ETU08_02285 [Apibacter muscae]|uniref:phage baseplate assembly protein V n=1 Tax=Apibacter muscae TaxID=2509004 RepID=UPI0011AD96F2|nr:phage baseplate assembly protein V [Apibacter muscae]TWP30851.1 hypothetical protein ETU08_02285 [Apibacter muscae]